MLKNMRFPIRFKILVILLLLVTSAVSLITLTMARFFHDDKTTYIRDITSVVALHMAEETRSMMIGYEEKLRIFANLIYDRGLSEEQKSELLKRLFADLQQFVAITVYQNGTERTVVYDASTFNTKDFTRDAFAHYRRTHPLPLERIQAGEVYVEDTLLSEKVPTFTMAIAPPIPDANAPVVIAALVRMESLMNLSSRSKVFETFIFDANGVFWSHTDPGQLSRQVSKKWMDTVTGLREGKTAGTTIEYTQNNIEMIGGFANVSFGGLTAGVQIPKKVAYLTARELLNNLIWVALAILIVSAIVSLFGSRMLTKPIEKLSKASRIVAKGQFDVKVNITSRDEIGMFADSFNQMASELESREKALKDSQTALIQSEKMAAFGQLGAGIAHEVKNPLAGILGFAQLTLRKLEKDNPLYDNLAMIEKEAKRSKTIIENLLKFARQEKVVFDKVAINLVVEESMAIVRHQLELNKIKLEKELMPELPPIDGNANQLEQVLMNLFMNAQQAMAGNPGKIKVSTLLLPPNKVEVRISDAGPGMSKEVQAKIFEPFFTTKPAGQGTGLGLSVSYGIIKEHRGDIRVESIPGEGATFIITLPAAVQPDMTPLPGDHIGSPA
ncbi:MAG: ATP-binding protein [Nitrospirae bacterium]|nr:ATP-binding protein [Nitrospirota bacterium]